MDENKNNIPTENEGEELDNILTLNDEDGNEVEFEFLDLIEYKENSFFLSSSFFYVCLIPLLHFLLECCFYSRPYFLLSNFYIY